MLHARHLCQILLEGLVVLNQVAFPREKDQIFAVNAQIFVHDVGHLAVHGEGADDEQQAQRELKNHQPLPEHSRTRFKFERTLQHLNGPESRQEKSRIGAREQAREQRQAQQPRHKSRSVVRNLQVFAGELIEVGQGQLRQGVGQQHRQESHQQRLTQKLPYQGSFGSPDHLSHAYLFGAGGGAGGGQVHEIDTGDQQHEHRHHRKQPHVLDPPAYRKAVLEFAVQVHLIKTVQVHVLFPFGIMLRGQRLYLLPYLRHLRLRVQQHVRGERGCAPFLQPIPGLEVILEGKQKVEL